MTPTSPIQSTSIQPMIQPAAQLQQAQIRTVQGKPLLLASDLEGVLIPEIWIAVAEKTGIPELRLTTRDIADYDQLMQMRLDILRQRGLGLADIQAVIATVEPLPGALRFLSWLRQQGQLIILSDTFYEFVTPLLEELGHPTVFCHSLQVAPDGAIQGYRLRLEQGKRRAVRAFQELGFFTVAVGDSYNDTAMLAQAHLGILFRPPTNVQEEFPHFPVVQDYAQLQEALEDLWVSQPVGD